MEPAQVLAQLELFASVPATELERLAAAASPRRLGRGQVLFVEGEPSHELFVVVSGRLKVLLSSSRGDDLVLAVIEAGDCLGELSVLDEQPRSASVEALVASVLLAVPAEHIRDMLQRCPAVGLDWAQALAGTVRRLTGSTADLVFLDLPRRLAKLLLDNADADATVHLGLSQTELAARLGVARQSLNRALGGLSRRGWLTVRAGIIELRDPAALARFADS